MENLNCVNVWRGNEQWIETIWCFDIKISRRASTTSTGIPASALEVEAHPIPFSPI